jgi:hypothetical protein
LLSAQPYSGVTDKDQRPYPSSRASQRNRADDDPCQVPVGDFCTDFVGGVFLYEMACSNEINITMIGKGRAKTTPLFVLEGKIAISPKD